MTGSIGPPGRFKGTTSGALTVQPLIGGPVAAKIGGPQICGALSKNRAALLAEMITAGRGRKSLPDALSRRASD